MPIGIARLKITFLKSPLDLPGANELSILTLHHLGHWYIIASSESKIQGLTNATYHESFLNVYKMLNSFYNLIILTMCSSSTLHFVLI